MDDSRSPAPDPPLSELWTAPPVRRKRTTRWPVVLVGLLAAVAFSAFMTLVHRPSPRPVALPEPAATLATAAAAAPSRVRRSAITCRVYPFAARTNAGTLHGGQSG